MLVEEVDTVFLHQTHGEGEVGFAVLHAIGDLVVALRRAEIEVLAARKAGLGEHLADDRRDILVEEDAAVRPVRQQPGPGPQHQTVVEEVVRLANPLGLGQDAVVTSLLIAVGVELERACQPEGGIEVDILLFTEGIEVEFKQFPEAFDAFELDQHEGILAQRRLEFADAVGLGQLSHRKCSFK